MQYRDAVRLLVDSYSGLTPELRKAAQYLVEHPEEIGLDSMRTVANRAGVKPATISRLSKTLGFREYDQLREPFRQRLRKSESELASRLQAIQRRGADNQSLLFTELRAQEIDNINCTLSDENYPILVDAVETMDSSRRLYVLGLRGAYAPAFLFHYSYQLFQDRGRLIDTRAGTFADQLRGIGDNDCLFVVSFSPYTQMTIDVVDYVRETGARIVALTDSIDSPVAKVATHTILTPNRSPSFYHSFTGALAVSQALIALLAAKTGKDAVKIVEEAERQLSRISAYW